MGCICETLAGKDVDLSPICIGHIWIFENLAPEELKTLVDGAMRKVFDRGQTIFFQGEPADKMFLIKAGRVKLSKVTEDGAEITLDMRKGGDFIGEAMLSEETDYPVTAWCMEKTLICGFSKRGFEEIVVKHPNIGLQVIRNLSQRIAWLTSRVGDLSITNLEERLHRVLLNVAREHGARQPHAMVIQFPLTHEDLAFLVGAHRVSITRAMKNLRESGKIIQEGKRLLVPLNP